MVPYDKIGEWAFILGVLVAVVAGLAAGVLTDVSGLVTLVLVILGLIVGFLNIGEKDIKDFLIAAIALVLVGTANLTAIDKVIPSLGSVLSLMVLNVAAFVAPAALVVALKAVYNLASKPS